MTPRRLSELAVEKINDEPSSNVPLKTSPVLKVKGDEISLIALPLSKNPPPEMLTVLPLSASKSLPNVPPERLTVLPLSALKSLPIVPPEILTVLPLSESNPLPTSPPEMLTVLPLLALKKKSTNPPEMLTVLPLLASKLSPTTPPEILTSMLVLEASPALKRLPTVPPSETFSWVLEEIPLLLPIELPENPLGFGLTGFSGRLMTVSNCA